MKAKLNKEKVDVKSDAKNTKPILTVKTSISAGPSIIVGRPYPA